MRTPYRVHSGAKDLWSILCERIPRYPMPEIILYQRMYTMVNQDQCYKNWSVDFLMQVQFLVTAIKLSSWWSPRLFLGRLWSRKSNTTQDVNMVKRHSLHLFQTTRVIINIDLLLNLEATFSRTSSGIDVITLWISMFQITRLLLTISVTAPLTLENLSLILLKGWNLY